MINSQDTLSNDISALDTAETIERDRKRDNDRVLLQNEAQMSSLNFFAFLLALFFDKDAEILQNDDAINEVASAFSIDQDVFRHTVSEFRDGNISGFQAARETISNIPDISKIDWDRAEDAVSKYAESGNPLLEIIADKESGGDYNRIYGAGHQTRPLTDMTVNEVLQWQKDYVNNGSPSSAAGKYQIIHKTLAGLKNEMGLTGEEKFDEAMQDKMAETLLNRRGYDEYLAGEISEEKFMENVSMEWAAAPKDMSGESFYEGDGLNQAHIEPATMLLAIRGSKEFDAEPKTQLAANFDTAKSSTEPLDTDQQQPVPLMLAFNGNEGVNEIETAPTFDFTNFTMDDILKAPSSSMGS